MTYERLDRVFAARKAAGQTVLIAYLTVGDPSVEESTACAIAALRAGADVLELGVPFSDATADGPVIAAASFRAIKQGGSLRAALKVAEAIRREPDLADRGLVLFSYCNPIYAYGVTQLPAAAAAAGVDALLVVDLPCEEGNDLRDAAEAAQLAVIPLIAPTTGLDREPEVIRRARGFLYYVSLTGVTGSGAAPLAEAGQAAAQLRERAKVPVVVGFGISTPVDARLVAAQGVDGVVVGTAIVKAIAAPNRPEVRVSTVGALVGSLRAGLDRRE